MNNDERDTLPFFIIVAAVMIFLFGLTLYTRTDLQEAPALIIFSVIMGFHTILHWFFRVFSRNRRHVMIYFYIQTAIAAGLVLYTRELSLVFGLFLPLLGEEVGLFRSRKAVLISVLVNSGLIAGSLLFYFNTESFDPLAFAGIIPLVFFVIIYVNLYNKQSDAKERAETLLKELEAANIRIEELAVDQERQRMARELHDTLAQGLSGLILQLEAVSVHLKKGNNGRADEIVGKAMFKARETLDGARMAIDGLRNKPAEAISLQHFLEARQMMFDGSEISYSFKSLENPVLDASQQPHIEKIITEALSNSIRHSKADNVEVEIIFSDSPAYSGTDVEAGAADEAGGLVLKIRDDGIGFDVENIPEGHYGLIGIRERCEMLGASMHLESGKNFGGGTSLTVKIPGAGR